MSEENINEILGIEDSMKSQVRQTVNSPNSTDNSAEKTLSLIASIILWLGILGSVICLFTITTTEVIRPGYYSRTETVFNPAGLAITIGMLISTVATWALLKVFVNISRTLKQINSKLK